MAMDSNAMQASSSDESPVDVSTPSTTSVSSTPESDGFRECGLEPIAIIGMGCRLPGDIASPRDLWKLIMEKRTAGPSKVPSSRFNIDAYYHQNGERPGSFNVPGGYFLKGSLQEFDPTMFDISPVEAAWMDPQQRKLLEVVYEAFENSGCTLDEVSAAVTGCFVGSFTSDFQQMALKEPDFRHSYATTGIDPGILGNRVSHVFNLHGPSLLVNTACSSSMFALHSACNAIRNGECEGAIVGGTNLIITVDQQMNTANLGVLSPTSTCHTFDNSADGYGRAEGVGALYVKSLDAALKNGDPIRAVIRSTATNCNGRLPDGGITHPSLRGQVEVISAAYKLANLDPSLTSYIECHGTGTQIGDPIEVHAISTAMESGTRSRGPILIGSIKPNIGHSESASSISTIIKAVLAVENEVIPPTSGLVTLNRKIKWSEWNVKVVTEPTLFSPSYPIRRVGVNAFGYGGTNSHAIIDNIESVIPDYRQHKKIRQLGQSSDSDRGSDKDQAHLLVFSAHDKATLKRNMSAYSRIRENMDLLDLAYTLSIRRSKLGCRAFAICRDDSYISDINTASENMTKHSRITALAFVFSGQGAQWSGMGAKLLALYPSFLQTIRELDNCLAKLPDAPEWKIETSLKEPDARSRVNEAEYSQPLCTAIQIALVDILYRWDVVPVATVGHSSGEIAAAYVAGHISREEAIITAYYRGKAASSMNMNGLMLAVGLGGAEAGSYVEKYNGRVVVACYNSPSSTTLSGDANVIEELKQTFDQLQIFARVVKTSGKAYHSYHMKEAAQIYERYLKNAPLDNTARLDRPRRPMMISSVSGVLINEEVSSSAYWAANLVSPVLFHQAFNEMMATTPLINAVVEIGPHSTLSGPIRQICSKNRLPEVMYMPTLKRNEHDVHQLLRLAGDVWARDASIDIGRVTRVESLLQDGSIKETGGFILVDLPPYQWNYTKTLWLEPRQSREQRTMKQTRHDILGRPVLGLSDLEPVWRNVLRHKDLPWLKHHSLGGEAVFPAAGYFAMAIEALTQLNSDRTHPLEIFGYTLRNIEISAALVVPDNDDGVETLFGIRLSNSKSALSEEGVTNQWYTFTVSSCSFGAWKVHTTGNIGINMRSRGREPQTPPELPLRSTYASWNERLRALGFDFGSTFQSISEIRTNGRTYAAASDMIVKQDCGIMNGESRYALHPACIDSCLQILIASIHAGRLGEVACGTVLTHFDEVSIWPPTPDQIGETSARAYAWTTKRGNRTCLSNAQLVAHDGELLADFVDVRSVSYEAAIPQQLQGDSGVDKYMQLMWEEDIAYPWSATTSESPALRHNILLVYRQQPPPFTKLLTAQFAERGWNVRSSALSLLEHQPGEQVIMLADLEEPLLATVQESELRSIQYLAENVLAMIWVTCGGLLPGQKPEYGLTTGLARVLRSEKQSLDLVTLDFDSGTSSDMTIAGILVEIATRQANMGRSDEAEYCVDHDRVFIGRIVPSEKLNEIYTAAGDHSKLVQLKDSPPLLGVLQSGKIYFQEDHGTTIPIKGSDVEVEVAAIGLNKEDSLVLAGSEDSTGFSHEIAGIVTAVGSDVYHIQVGDRVVGFAFDNLATRQRTSGKLVQPIVGSDSLQMMATIPMAFVTAMYGLYELACVKARDIVLILEGSGSTGLAAIQLCKLKKAKTLVVTDLEDTITLLQNTGFPADQIITPGNEDVRTQIQRVTAGHGVDIVFSCDAAGPMVSDECCKSIASFGRLVHLGRKHMSTGNSSDILKRVRGGSVFAFEAQDLYEEKPDLLARLLVKCMQLYNEGKITPISPLTTKSVSEINEAIGSVSSSIGAGKIVVPYEQSSLFNVTIKPTTLQFRSDATYLLVGCLGGLGRSLTIWMIERGVKHLAFVSRSGTDSPSAAALVDSIRDLGVDALVLRADVASKEQLEVAMREVDTRFPVRGVVNAAMVLQDGFFHTMTIDSWRKVVDPKLKGSRNLHELFSLPGQLDFFVMTSSISATVGSAGQSNYAAANAYLDALSHHRHSLSLPSTSLALPMILGIGYVASHPEIEAQIRRKGMYGVSALEMLSAFEAAMAPHADAIDHIIVGLSPALLAKSIASTTADVPWLSTPRFSALRASVDQYSQSLFANSSPNNHNGTNILLTISTLPPTAAISAVTAHLIQRLSRLLMLEPEVFEAGRGRSIASYGLDSMIGAEFRNWIFREFGVDVGFQRLLGGDATVGWLAGELVGGVKGAKGE
ncbi:hypothetical protein MMC30_008880 [Trapelia coarctata]|nr:hypothetical protein [Trapelia coarctata]